MARPFLHCRLPLVTALLAGAVLVGCQDRRISVQMTAAGGQIDRSFSTNRLERGAAERVAAQYGTGPVARAPGKVVFEGSFDSTLPSEVGNRNGLSEIATELGTAHFYFEAFGPGAAAERDGSTPAGAVDNWATLQQRMAAGELWVRLFGRWAERFMRDSGQLDAWREWVDTTLVPAANNVMLQYGSMQATAQSQRVGGRLRNPDENAPRTPDETFWRQVFMPLLLTLASDGGTPGTSGVGDGRDGPARTGEGDVGKAAVAEHAGAPGRVAIPGVAGFLTPEEAHTLLLLSNDGNAGGNRRQWSVENIFLTAVTRQVQRFRPDVQRVTLPQVFAAGISFYLYATSSPDRIDLLLASPAISEVDKTRLRNGEHSISLPPPYGIEPRRRPASTVTDVRLAMPVEPYATNGVWDAEQSQVVFTTRFYDAANRTVLYEPIFYAAWATPAVDRQRALFGRVLLAGERLADYCLWEHMLAPEERIAWSAALLALERDGSLEEVDRFLRSYAERMPPKPLVDWLARVRAGLVEVGSSSLR